MHDNVDHPVSLYAASKKANELMAHTYAHLYRLPTTGLRFFTVYGPWGRPDMALFEFTRRILAGEPIDVFNNGHHARDFTYIDDIVEGVVRTADKIPAPDPNWSGDNPDPAKSKFGSGPLEDKGGVDDATILKHLELLRTTKPWLPNATPAGKTDLRIQRVICNGGREAVVEIKAVKN